MIRKTRNDIENSQLLALKALAFLAQDDERLSYFLNSTGLDLDSLKARAGDVDMLAGILDHLLSHEQLLLEFSADQSFRPESVVAARQSLPGASYDP